MTKTNLCVTRCVVLVVLVALLITSLVVIPTAAIDSNVQQEAGIGGGGGYNPNPNSNNYDKDFVFKDFANFSINDAIETANQKAAQELSGIRLGVYHVTKWFSLGPAIITSLAASTVIAGSQVVQNNRSWAEDFGDAFLIVGRLFCVLYFLLSLMDAASRDSFTVEAFIKSLSKLVIILIIFDPDTLSRITYFARAIEVSALQAISSASIDGDTSNQLIEHIANVKEAPLWGIGIILSLDSLAALTNISALIVAACISISRAVEILTYQTFLPLAMGSLYDGGLRSPGMRYIKKWIALYLQGPVIIVIAALISRLAAGNFLLGGGLNVIKDMAFALIIISLLTRSKSIANDIMGV